MRWECSGAALRGRAGAARIVRGRQARTPACVPAALPRRPPPLLSLLLLIRWNPHLIVFSLLSLFSAEEVKKEWKKAAKGDAAVRLATLMNEEGKQGVEAAFEQARPWTEGMAVGEIGTTPGPPPLLSVIA